MEFPPDKLMSALAWAARGFKVFPIVEGTKDQPLVPFTQEATTDETQIRRWWQDALTGIVRGHNIGVLTTDHPVVDIDTKGDKPGLQSHGDLGGTWDTLVVRTPSGGFHAYHDAPYAVANSIGDVAPGIDIRGFHGYVLAPGSIVDGKPYELWVDKPLAPLPAAILARCRQPGDRPTAATGSPVELDTPAALASAASYVHEAPGAPQGDRSGACYRLACQLRERGVSEAVAIDLVVAHWIERCLPAFDRGEAVEVVGHAYRYAQNAEGSRSAEADFEHLVGLIEPPPALVVAPIGVSADAWAWGNIVPLAMLKARPWVCERMLLRGEVTALIAPGGIGKSQLTLTKAILFALGAPDLWGLKNYYGGRRVKSVIYNAEDSRNEMSARVYATCAQMNVDPVDVAPYLTLISGKEIRLKLVQQSNGKPELVRETVQRLIDYASDPDCMLLGLDPLIALHDMEEGLATGMRYVMETLVLIAERADTAVELAVHTPKPGNQGASFYVGNAEAGRGSVTIRDTARVVLTLAPPKESDVEENNIPHDERHRLLRLDDAKMNYDLMGSSPVWLRKHTVSLWTGDKSAAIMPYDMLTAGAAARIELATKCALELINDGTADMGLKDMAGRIHGTDPLYAQLTLELTGSRIERTLAGGVATVHGSVRAEPRHGKKCVVLE